jgi:hypothetical protein
MMVTCLAWRTGWFRRDPRGTQGDHGGALEPQFGILDLVVVRDVLLVVVDRRLVSAGELVDPEAGVALVFTPENRICQFRKSYLYKK